MFKIIKKQVLNPYVILMKVYAPYISKKAQPGQFIMLRVNQSGERIPLTIADFNGEEGSITIIFQEVGKTTKLLASLNEGESILDFVGPLGKPTELDNIKKAAVIGGGLGTAIAHPQAKKLYNLGSEVDIIAGFRSNNLIILEEELKSVSTNLVIATDDGSNGNKGFVTDVLKQKIESGRAYDLVIAIGPLVMMKAVTQLCKAYNINTTVSMNPIMIDGTGMCGGCRVTVGGKVKFACVDGPDFDGHQVDFDEAIRRNSMYKDQEKQSFEHHSCRLFNR